MRLAPRRQSSFGALACTGRPRHQTAVRLGVLFAQVSAKTSLLLDKFLFFHATWSKKPDVIYESSTVGIASFAPSLKSVVLFSDNWFWLPGMDGEWEAGSGLCILPPHWHLAERVSHSTEASCDVGSDNNVDALLPSNFLLEGSFRKRKRLLADLLTDG